MASFFLDAEGHEDPVHVQVGTGSSGKYAVQAGESVYEVDRASLRGDMFFIRNGKIIPFHAVEKNGSVSVWVDGKTFRFQLVNPAARRAQSHSAPAASDAITASMPGRILRVHVKAGDAVASDQPLIVMESMKMEMTLSSPRDAIVEAVMCGEGDRVEIGQTLLKLDGGDQGG